MPFFRDTSVNGLVYVPSPNLDFGNKLHTIRPYSSPNGKSVPMRTQVQIQPQLKPKVQSFSYTSPITPPPPPPSLSLSGGLASTPLPASSMSSMSSTPSSSIHSAPESAKPVSSHLTPVPCSTWIAVKQFGENLSNHVTSARLLYYPQIGETYLSGKCMLFPHPNPPAIVSSFSILLTSKTDGSAPVSKSPINIDFSEEDRSN